MDCPLVMIGVNKGCRYYEIGEEIILKNGRNLLEMMKNETGKK